MPAIHPERLKQEASELAPYFSEPDKFTAHLVDLLDRHADRIRRPGQTGAPPPLLQAFRVSPPVLRQIMLTLTPCAQREPGQALEIVDMLWARPYLETRLLAARLLGVIPFDDPAPILARVRHWTNPKEEEVLLDEVFEKGLAGIYLHSPRAILETIKEWMGSSQSEYQILAAKALLPLAKNPDFENFPLIYKLLLPRVLEAAPTLRPHLLAIIRALGERSPQETAHFLHQVVIVTDKPGTTWIARQALDLFPDETQERIKEAIRNR